MSFISLAYLIFLPLTFALYWLRRSERWQNAVLLMASLVFYGWWSMGCLALMLGVVVANYGAARCHSRWATPGIIVCNLGVLGIFKYYDFFAATADLPTLGLLLPIGISFYTFQLTAYVIDVQRGTVPAERSLLRFATFVCFFPQLVAGPIERAAHLLPQMQQRRTFCATEATEGMRLILWGLVKKMLVADNCAATVDYAFANTATLSAPELWVGALCFAFQIYGDFSGYSDIAVGSARLFGIRLTRNFDRPYFAASIPDFWRRWHISLMQWLRDYLYIPLGGNRRGTLRRHLNTLCVFLASGLWHGANWTFVLWGAYHAVLFIPATLLGSRCRLVGRMITPVLVVMGWVIFRAESVSAACAYLRGMWDFHAPAFTLSRLPLMLIAALLLAEWRGTEPLSHIEHAGLLRSAFARYALYFLLFAAVLWWGGETATFIYFQF